MGKLPKQKPSILIRKIGQEAMLYDTNREMVHILNITGEMVWNCCDGNTMLDEAEQKLRESYTVTQGHDVKEDIRQILAGFSKLNLLCVDHEDTH